jgi:hypothetical protein
VQTAPAPSDNDEASFKKRYGDLRRHTQQLMEQKDQEISAVKAQLDTAAKGQIRFPKTDDETKLTRKEAEQQLVQVHPDFNVIRQDAAFHDWVALQPQNIQDSLYKNNTDARAAARAIDLYKSDTGKR